MPHRTIYFYLTFAILYSVSFLFGERSHAQYPSAKMNANIREEVESDPNRLIPLTEHFAFAVDGDAYYRDTGSTEFYHGIGYWLQARSEVRLSPWLKANLRSILYAGSVSGGYAEPSGSYHLFAITGQAPDEILGANLIVRAGDLDRQTIGEGLLIQNKEMNGASVRWSSERHGVLFRLDGTGVLKPNGDTFNFETWIFQGIAGAGAVAWSNEIAVDNSVGTREPYWYLFSKAKIDWFSYGAEYGGREGAMAALIALKAENDFGPLKFNLKLEGRRYNSGIGGSFKRLIQHQYISYDQLDKSFTDALNVFVVDDNATVGAAHLNIWLRISEYWKLHSLNETGQFAYPDFDQVKYYFFRHGIEFCPVAERDDCVSAFFSNKTLSDSFARPPSGISRSNETLFRIQPFVGMEARFRF